MSDDIQDRFRAHIDATIAFKRRKDKASPEEVMELLRERNALCNELALIAEALEQSERETMH